MKRRRIAILFHEADARIGVNGTGVAGLVPFWKEDGHSVIALFGPDSFVEADLLIVHVDLTEVPSEYLAFSSRYPIAINGKVTFIALMLLLFFSPIMYSNSLKLRAKVEVNLKKNLDFLPLSSILALVLMLLNMARS